MIHTLLSLSQNDSECEREQADSAGLFICSQANVIYNETALQLNHSSNITRNFSVTLESSVQQLHAKATITLINSINNKKTESMPISLSMSVSQGIDDALSACTCKH